MAGDLVERVEQSIRRQQSLAAGMRVAVACSGGADSVALLLLLTELREALGLRLLVAHLNHQLRGAEADADEGFVRQLAERLGLECVVRREDVAARARERRLNLEEAGRASRMEFFASLLASRQADAVALAHTLDDQAETVLGRILRGAGTRGLAAIYPVVKLAGGAGWLVRPLLGIRRAELRAYLSQREQAWREDTSNLERIRLRNRLRLELLPVFVRQAGAAGVEHLAQLAEQAREDESFWAAVIEERFRSVVKRRGDAYELSGVALQAPLPGLEALPERQAREARRAVARRLVRRVLGAVRGDLRRITQKHVESVLRLAEAGQSGQRVELPEVVVERRFDLLVFQPAARAFSEGAAGATGYRLQVDAPGPVRLPGGRLLCFKLVGVEEVKNSYNYRRGVVDADRVKFPLVVRSWQPGDSYQPAGATRRKKLKTLFQRGRIPVGERVHIPVVLCGGEILWVPRFGIAAGYGPLPESRTVLVIEERADE